MERMPNCEGTAIGRRGGAKVLDRRGFTVVELLVYMVIAVIVVGGVYQVLIGQNRLYSKQRELQDVRGTLRAAGNLLAFELRQAASSEGDLYAISDTSFMLRSMIGSGVLCRIEPVTGFVYSFYKVTGSVEPRPKLANGTPRDSLFLFSAGGTGTGDDQWLTLGVDTMTTNTGAVDGMEFCVWGDSSTIASDLLVRVDTAGVGVPTGVTIGAPVRFFERVQYGLYQDGGRWWLGRALPQVLDDYERLIGPMMPPNDSGLALIYYDASGNPTSDPSQVRMVDIVLRAESLKQARGDEGMPAAQEDSMTIRVYLRG